MNPVLHFEMFVDAIASPFARPELSWRPVFIRLTANDFEDFTILCRKTHIVVIDTIDRQLNDLAIVKFPSPRESTNRVGFIEDTLAVHGGRASYGIWVYLPWESKIVHLLDCDDYFDVITNRNRDSKRGVNIAYAADERGFLSVEPYQYRSDLLPFHGRTEHLQPSREDFPTPVAFMRALSI